VGEQNYSFSSPADGIIEVGSIAYPINQGCGTLHPRSNHVKVWVNYNAGAQSKSVTIPLVCSTS
jgi:L-cysteine desulfidase